jgi:SAM-dependent methyltransferase
MKARESGMPEEELWNSFFDADRTLDELALTREVRNVVEFGGGYGTFTIPAARRVRGLVYTLDIEAEMLAAIRTKAHRAGLNRVIAVQRDFVEQGTGLPGSFADYAMLFNILHAERPDALLAEALQVLAPGGLLAVTHWNYDPATPRGPAMSIRPRPKQCQAWVQQAGFEIVPPGMISNPPYHYGFVARKPRVRR